MTTRDYQLLSGTVIQCGGCDHILNKPRVSEVLPSQGATVGEAGWKLGVTEHL